MSQDELAEKLQVTRQSVSLWETGQTQPSLDSIVALSKLFNVSTDDLLMDEQPEPAATVAPKTSKEPKKKNE
jgi:DNA-binding XRE family transcriptional regulator